MKVGDELFCSCLESFPWGFLISSRRLFAYELSSRYFFKKLCCSWQSLWSGVSEAKLLNLQVYVATDKTCKWRALKPQCIKPIELAFHCCLFKPKLKVSILISLIDIVVIAVNLKIYRWIKLSHPGKTQSPINWHKAGHVLLSYIDQRSPTGSVSKGCGHKERNWLDEMKVGL